MPLTPADVHNVAFKKPPIGKRGYDEDEVDAFLDEVERELARLIEENNELRAQLERAQRARPASPTATQQPVVPAQASGPSEADQRLARENAELKTQMQQLEQRLRQAAAQAVAQPTEALPVPMPIPAPMPAQPTGGSDGEQALSVLMTAQRTANEHVADARREADKLLLDARAKADEVTREARTKADALEREARQRHQEAMGGLEMKRQALQKHIEELKAFEREYRTRLKAYLESQLRDLDGRGAAIESDSGRAAGASSFVTSANSALGQSDQSQPGSRR
ncbi:MAG: DivIVA domain-containing protein [Actinomycetota bacterium]|nr:DivIVA domain-containing protein [Actinomycetota bacterium]